ncbi:GNAT family N-acetyltransferase [Streptomyces sp. NPDC052042]|uniref:GNAT family N-acetyltransferase n=1 Tax=Streptomyces sp. NPDC052042 TaxID=3365683 RepID=UPI0037D24828
MPALPAAVGGWTLRPAPSTPVDGGLPLPATARAYSVLRGGSAPAFRVEVQRVLSHPLRGCYPVGARDLLLSLLPLSARSEPEAAALLDALARALFGADPRCRRVMAAPDADDVPALERYAAGHFRPVAEADLRERTVTLMVVEPSRVTEVSTALDDMPH